MSIFPRALHELFIIRNYRISFRSSGFTFTLTNNQHFLNLNVVKDLCFKFCWCKHLCFKFCWCKRLCYKFCWCKSLCCKFCLHLEQIFKTISSGVKTVPVFSALLHMCCCFMFLIFMFCKKVLLQILQIFKNIPTFIAFVYFTG